MDALGREPLITSTIGGTVVGNHHIIGGLPTFEPSDRYFSIDCRADQTHMTPNVHACKCPSRVYICNLCFLCLVSEIRTLQEKVQQLECAPPFEGGPVYRAHVETWKEKVSQSKIRRVASLSMLPDHGSSTMVTDKETDDK